MRYDDASQAGSMAEDSAPVARADVDALPPGSFGPASGNTITGTGTITGTAGADSPGDAPAAIVELQGAGGSSTGSGGSLQATGQYGVLNMDAQGNYDYVRNAGTPDGVQDVFQYTLADADGSRSTTTLTIQIAEVETAEAVIPGVVNLPPGVELSDIRVSGRDLIITLPDGSQMVIPGGAVFVPQLVIGDVQVPPSNLAALLIESEPQPAAGQLQSSGGNFAAPVPPLDPGVPLGDLIPPTELVFTPPDFEEVFDLIDEEPEIVIIPDGQPAAVNAIDSVDESGLPARGSEPEGTLEPQDIETTSGVISFTAEDGVDSLVISAVGVTGETVITSGSVGTVIHGLRGDLTITSVNFATGQIGYTYTALDNTIDGVNDFDDFSVTLTDSDGDVVTATLRINIEDDEPIARNDTDSVGDGQTGTDGNVITGLNTTSGNSGADTPGADGIDGETNDAIDGVTGIRAGTSGSFTAVPQNGAGVVVNGQFGDLTIHVDGSYTYTLHNDIDEGGNDVFTYQLTDGDGDTVTATLTISVPDDTEPEIVSVDDTVVDEDGLENANVDSDPLQSDPDETDSTESATGTGEIVIDFHGDVPGNLLNAIVLVDDPALDGQLETVDGVDIVFALEGGDLVGRPLGGGDPLVIISITGAVAGPGAGQATYTYEVQLLGPVEHADGGTEETSSEDTITLSGVGFQVTDSDGDPVSGTFDVDIVDDVPTAAVAREPQIPTLVVDESPIGEDEGGDSDPAGVRTATADFSGAFAAPIFGADGEGSVTYALVLSSEGAGSGLFALDASDTDDGDGDGIGQGDEILLFTEADGSITGRLTVDGPIYFTISVEESGVDAGEVTFEQSLNVWHADDADDDDTSTLSADPNTIALQQVVTDADGDVDTASVDLSDDVFQIEDDGPSLPDPDASELPPLVVDESPIGEDEGGDSNPAGVRTATADFSGAFGTGSFGTDGAGSVSFALALSSEGAGSGLFALDATDTDDGDGDGIGQGDEILLFTEADGSITGRLTVDGPIYFTISVDENTGEVTFEQSLNVWHANTGSDDDTSFLSADPETILLEQTIVDADGDSETAAIDLSDDIFQIEDDGPSLPDPDASELPTLVVDESPIGEDEGGDSDPAGVRTATADFSGAFGTGSFGTDGAGSVSFGLVLASEGAGSGLFALDASDTDDGDGDGIGQGDEILLFTEADGSITGRLTVDGPIYFTISVVETGVDAGEVTFEQSLNVWHADETDDDDTSTLSADPETILLEQTIVDADGDSETAAIDLSDGVFNIEDDGPSLPDPDTSELPTLVVDESPIGEDEGGDSDPVGVRTATADFSGAFGTGDFGTDGEGSASFALVLSSEGAGSGLFALDATDTDDGDGDGIGQGDEILLFTEADGSITGRLTVDGPIYFTISVEETGVDAGEVTFEQSLNVWHADETDDDDTSTLSADPETILLEQTITDADGDSETAAIDLSDGIFNIEDDGPSLPDPDTSELPTLVVDESPIDEDEGGDSDPPGVRTATGDFSGAFGTGSFGTDGAGSVSFALVLASEGAGSGLFALDATDTDDGDGDGIGQGDEILLFTEADGSITGRLTVDGPIYFTISVEETGVDAGEVTFEQSLNVWHSDTADDDDTSTLSADANTITLEQTIVDADGDSETAAIDLSDGIFNIEDDGPADFTPVALVDDDESTETTQDDVIVNDGTQQNIIRLLNDSDNDGTGEDFIGTDGFGSLAFTGGTDGDQLEDAEGNPLTSGGAAILLVGYGTSTLTGFVESGDTEGFQSDEDTVVFTITLNEGTGSGANSTYEIDFFQKIDDGSGFTFSDLSGGDAGNPAYKLISEPGQTTELLVTPINETTVNSDEDDIAAGSQFIEFDTGIRFDFGAFTHHPNGGGGADDRFTIDGHENINDFKFTIDQISNGSVVDIRITAIDADNDGGLQEQNVNQTAFVDTDAIDPITEIKIYDDNGVLIATFTGDGTYDEDFGTVSTADDVHIAVDFDTTGGDSGSVLITGLPSDYSVQTHTATGYNRIEIFNEGTASPDGKFSVSELTIGSSATGDPIDLSFGVTATDADGDTSTGTIDFTLVPEGSTTTTLSTLSTQDVESFSLLASNDNSGEQQSLKIGNNTVLMGALAAAGLSSSSLAAADDFAASNDIDLQSLSVDSGLVVEEPSVERGRGGGSVDGKTGADKAAEAQSNGSNSNDDGSDTSLTDANEADAPAPMDLLEGTETPGGDSDSSSLTSDAIVMAGAELLEAEAEGGVEGGEAQHNAVVGQVLADALNGGGDGANLDALINALPGGGNGLEALASQGDGGVPNGDIGVFAGFTGGVGANILETMHHDAVQTSV